MKYFILILTVFTGGIITGWFSRNSNLSQSSSQLTSPVSSVPTPVPQPLLKYSFDNLRQSVFTPKTITLSDKIKDDGKFTNWLFIFESQEGRISGTANIPDECGAAESKCPVVIMLRGYVVKEVYQPGTGTRKAAEVYANNGFITLAPDFLGFGTSDPEPENEIESRLIKPATVLQLLASIPNLSMADPEKVFLWGHSNGGQIGLSVLALTDKFKAASFWAPVSKPFPYSILYYTDDLDDHGKYLRKAIFKFESVYDPELFSLNNYLDRINTSVIVHQGTADDSVPFKWSMDLVKSLQALKKKAVLYQYSGADHNLMPVWNSVVNTDLQFFRKFTSPFAL